MDFEFKESEKSNLEGKYPNWFLVFELIFYS